jgi:hypothetical protein
MTDRDHVAGEPLPALTDEMMRGRIGRGRPYTAMVLRETASFRRPDVDPIVWEHARRMMALAEHGVLVVVLPDDNDPTDWSGLGVFTVRADEVWAIMDHARASRRGSSATRLPSARHTGVGRPCLEPVSRREAWRSWSPGRQGGSGVATSFGEEYSSVSCHESLKPERRGR